MSGRAAGHFCHVPRDRTAGAWSWTAEAGRRAVRVHWGPVGRTRQACTLVSSARSLATDQPQLTKALLRPAHGSWMGR